MTAILHYALLDSFNASLMTINHMPDEGALLRGFSLHGFGESQAMDCPGPTMMIWLRQGKFTMAPTPASMLYDVRTSCRPTLITSTDDLHVVVRPDRADGQPHHVTVFLDRRAT